MRKFLHILPPLMSNTFKKPTLGLLMMLKNEHLRIKFSLESVKTIVDCVIILDTGSEDDTIAIVTSWCKEHNLPLYLKEEPFVDFSASRNVSLDFADDKADYVLLLDCNDEAQEGHKLREFVDNYTGISSAFHLCQQWWNGASVDKYFNTRLVRTKHGWRYRGVVHEYLSCTEADSLDQLNKEHMKLKKQLTEDRETDRLPKNRKKEKDYKKEKREVRDEQERLLIIEQEIIEKQQKMHLIKIDNGFVLYQDRTMDDDKSMKRFSRDKILLYNEFLKDPHNARTLFYLAQTCSCLSEPEDAYKYYKLRQKEGGFNEEMFHAYFRCGNLVQDMGHEWQESFYWYIKAYEYSCSNLTRPRVEPLIKIADYYHHQQNWKMAYTFLKFACELTYPEESILFVDKRDYDYTRWHLMAIVAYWAKELEVGKISCINACIIDTKDIDRHNMQFYIPDEKKRLQVFEAIERKELKSIPSILNEPIANQNISIIKEVEPLTTKEKMLQKLKKLKEMRKDKKHKKV